MRIRERHEDERYNVEDTWNAKSITKEWKCSAAHFKFLQNKRLRMQKFLHKMYESVTIAVLKLWLRANRCCVRVSVVTVESNKLPE